MTIAAAIDHVVITVEDRLDAAEAAFRRLGFALTERGHHTLGSSNHLAIFGTDYLELLGWEPGRPVPGGMASRPPGLRGLAMKPPPEADMDAALAAAGIAAEPSREFGRPVALPGGMREARFRVTQVSPAVTPYGQLFFCRHFTPDLVWRPEWQAHPNRATGVAEIVLAVEDVAAATAPYARLLGPGAVTAVEGGAAVGMAGGAALLCLTPAAAARRHAGATPPGAGQFVALTLRSADLAATRALLAAAGVALREGADGRIVVPAAEAGGAALAFIG